MMIHAHPPRLPDHPQGLAHDSAAALTLEQLARELALLQPPPAYRLSLDSGVGYRNVRRAVEKPLTARLATWQRLLHSLRSNLVATPGNHAPQASWPLDTPARAGAGLRAARRRHGWSQRELARRAGVCVDAVIVLERGQGLLGQWQRICTTLGVQLGVALAPPHDTLAALWREQAPRCLQEPAQYPIARQRATSSTGAVVRR